MPSQAKEKIRETIMQFKRGYGLALVGLNPERADEDMLQYIEAELLDGLELIKETRECLRSIRENSLD